MTSPGDERPWRSVRRRLTLEIVGPMLAYIAAALVGLWGVAHAIPTMQVVAGFEPVTSDNRRVILQEWLAESITMFGVASLVIAVTAAGADASVAATVYRVAAGILVA